MSNKNKSNLKRNLLICLLAGSAVAYTLPLHAATSVIANNQLPGNILQQFGGVTVDKNIDKAVANITQQQQNAVIKWDSFNIGGNATVNFDYTGKKDFNTLNYINKGVASQIYGTINAQHNAYNGNIYIVNPAGVQIGNSAQINVGSLYVSNKNLDAALVDKDIDKSNITALMAAGTMTNAELMSLGSINAVNNVTFEGDRIVIDTERVLFTGENANLNDSMVVKTTDTDNVVLGYLAYDETNGYKNAAEKSFDVTKLTVDKNGTVAKEENANVKGYMWVENINQLQAIDDNLGGNYALRNSIDASGTLTWNSSGKGDKQKYLGFKPIGIVATTSTSLTGVTTTTYKVAEDEYGNKGFLGKFDGLKYSIFDLNINRPTSQLGGNSVGLFGAVEDASINNVTLVGGNITGQNFVGGVVGYAHGATTISNSTNSANVTGNLNVGGILGNGYGQIDDDGNIRYGKYYNLVNTGTISGTTNSSNAIGGLIGRFQFSSLGGESYNLGKISTKGYNVGGLIGFAAQASNVGDKNSVLTNYSDITGSSNVGGIVGKLEGATIQNAENKGNIVADGFYNVNFTTNSDLYTNVYTYYDENGKKVNIINYSAKIPQEPNPDNYRGGNYVNNPTQNPDYIAAMNDYEAKLAAYYEKLYVLNSANAGGIAGYSHEATGSHNDTNIYTSKIINVLNTGDVSSSKVEETDYYRAGNVGGIVGRAENTNIEDAVNRDNQISGAHNVGGIAGYFGSRPLGHSVTNEETGEVTTYTPDAVKFTISNSENYGGEVLGTGARGYEGSSEYPTDKTNVINETGFATETVSTGETHIIGNIGGIVGYMEGDSVYITGVTNSGNVHTVEPATAGSADAENAYHMQAANVGGIVGKIDRSNTIDNVDELFPDTADRLNPTNAAVSNSYNTGTVVGYANVGGIAGQMYNGEIASTHNNGAVNTTKVDGGALNMGGIVGDTTANSNSSVLLYDVYNEGNVGDDTFVYYGSNVGGVVGRLNGQLEKAYNRGQIYNAYNNVGGVAGYVYNGNIENAFNTGNITVLNKSSEESNVGGIAGAVRQDGVNVKIDKVYNLGTLRSFRYKDNSTEAGDNVLGGIVGAYLPDDTTGLENEELGTLTISNAYTTGNLGIYDKEGTGATSYKVDADGIIGSIYGTDNSQGSKITTQATFYIKPDAGNGYTALGRVENDTTGTYVENKVRDNSNTAIAYADKNKIESYTTNATAGHALTVVAPNKNQGNVDTTNSDWRIYEGTTPILNAFLPYAEDYFADNGLVDSNDNNNFTVQYGTAYNPTLTIIQSTAENNSLTFDWQKLGIKNMAGLAVYGANLTLNNFVVDMGNGHFNGRIYTDGALVVNANNDDKAKDDISLGYRSYLYGSSVTVNANGHINMSGNVIATGNANAGETDGSVHINGGDVDNYGVIHSAVQKEGYTVDGINKTEQKVTETAAITNPFAELVTMGDRYAHTTNAYQGSDGDVVITAEVNKNGSGSTGNVGLYIGSKETGHIEGARDLTVDAGNNIYIDSDLDIDGDITLTTTNANGEIVLDITNLGKIQTDAYIETIYNALRGMGLDINDPDAIAAAGGDGTTVEKNTVIKAIADAIKTAGSSNETENAAVARRIYNLLVEAESGNNDNALANLEEAIQVAYMHDVLHDFEQPSEGVTGQKIVFGHKEIDGSITAHSDVKLAVDMWDYRNNAFDLNKYDGEVAGYEGRHTLKSELDNLNMYNGTTLAKASEVTHIWISDAEQLKGIETYASTNKDSGAYGYHYAVKNDIDASGITDYKAIGTGSDNGFEGTFDGRGYNILGLTVNGAHADAGIFSTVAAGAEVSNINLYSSSFKGSESAGGIAGINHGTIENIYAFGNRVEVTGTENGAVTITGADGTGTVSVGAAGGIAGVNTGAIMEIDTSGTVIAGDNDGGENAPTTIAGGVVGVNISESKENPATITNVRSDSDVTGTNGNTYGLGGVAGFNSKYSIINTAESLGVTLGRHFNETENPDYAANVGGITGVNMGEITNAYNESVVNGLHHIGGISGRNNGGKITNVVNAADVMGMMPGSVEDSNKGNFIGGLVGANSGDISNGRNNGAIEGQNYIGGLVGDNAKDSKLENLTNDSSASITGEEYVGGVAGRNAGAIKTVVTDGDGNVLTSIVNRGTITGQKYVGGVAGSNEEGGQITNANNDVELFIKDSTKDAQYFGGVVGYNKSGAMVTNATNAADVNAKGAEYVGGIAGQNDGILQDMAGNSGNVIGKNFVGGVAGKNTAATTNILYATNSGTVIATDGAAGGIYSENNGHITNATLTNSGMVIGKNGHGTGGVIGVNYGDVSESSLQNEIGGTVVGQSNVGGVIGINYGEVKGGRAIDAEGKDLGYYAYQIYNNGTVIAGQWVDSGADGIADGVFEVSEIKKNPADSSNIGGLIGHNATKTEDGTTQTGSLTAAYNTGVVDAASSTNVGGVVGSNAGTVDQVFNTVMTAAGAGAITGGSNTGGVVGTNSGTLTNAYNTTEVIGTGAGNVVGTNSGTISNVYATNTRGKLIGSNANGESVKNAYTFAENDDTAHLIDGVDRQKQSGSYEGFDIDDTGDTAATWKIYDGYSNPLLKVFLTTLKVNDSVNIDGEQVTLNDYLKLVYNAGEQDINISDLINKGFITAPQAEAFAAYYNTLMNNELDESYLLDNADGQVNASQYSDWLYSAQIHQTTTEGAKFNPNNLGYDVVLTASVDKATINITLDDIYRTYGDVSNIYRDQGRTTGTTYEQSYTIDKDSLNAALQEYINNYLTVEVNSDSSLISKDKTQNVGAYDWSMNVKIGGDNASNYQINDSNSTTATVTGTGKAHVEKADLTITLTDVEREYGNKALANDTAYGITSATLVNGDSGLLLNENAVKTDGAVTNGKTNDVSGSPYKWSVTKDANNFTGVDNLGTNYNITVVNGNSKVTPKSITIKDLVASIVYGNQDSKGFVVNDALSLEGVVYDDIVTIGGTAVYDVVSGSEYATNRNGRVTADVRDTVYADSLSVSGITLGGTDAGNYVLDTTQAVGDIKVTPATLNVTLNDVERVYGSQTLSNVNYGVNVVTGVVNGDGEDAIKNSLTFVLAENSDGALVYDRTTGRVTQDVGDYKYTGAVTTNNGNYIVNVSDGNSKVTPAKLTVTVDNVSTTYGTAFKTEDYKHSLSGLTNGDTEATINSLLSGEYTNSAACDGTNGKWTADAGTHEDAVGYDYNTLKNYTVNVVKGDAVINKATVEVTLQDIKHTYGKPNNEYAIKDAIVWVNGDGYTKSDVIFTNGSIADTAIDKATGKTKPAGGNYTWTADVEATGTNAENISNNYNFKVIEAKSEVDKAKLNINLGDVTHTYGDPNENGYNIKDVTGWVYDEDFSTDIILSGITDNALKDKNHTNDANTAEKPNYTWTADGATITGNGNYDFVINAGNSYVDKAELTIKVNDVATVYGDLFKKGQYGYSFATELANGDSEDAIRSEIGEVTYKNNAEYTGHAGKNTANAGTYTNAVTIHKGELHLGPAENNTLLKNYSVVVQNGTATVHKAKLHIGAGNQSITVGQKPNYAHGSKDIAGQLVNGDRIDNYRYDIADAALESTVGTHSNKIGIVLNGKYYDLSKNQEWHKVDGLDFLANYDIDVTPGTLTVSGTTVVPEPEVPVFELPQDWPHNRWDYLFNDHPFDRNRNFRERKAEVNYVDGGMEI